MLTGEPGPGASEPSGRSTSLLDEVCDVALDARVVGTSLRRRLALRTGSSLLVLEGIPRATALRRVSFGSLRYIEVEHLPCLQSKWWWPLSVYDPLAPCPWWAEEGELVWAASHAKTCVTSGVKLGPEG